MMNLGEHESICCQGQYLVENHFAGYFIFSDGEHLQTVLNVCVPGKEIDLLLCTLGDEFLTFDYLHSKTLFAIVDAFAA